MINVYIISGFLGAGKTTLIQKLLPALKKPMLIENEFGEVGVDAAFFADNLKVREINNGCICCSMQGNFQDALDEIRSYDIENLIIEPSGVGKLSDIIPSVLQTEDFRLVSHACVVDVKTAYKYHHNFKEYFDDQVIMANAIVLSHLDIATPKQIEEAKKIINILNDEALVNERSIDRMNAEELLDFIVKNISMCPECAEMNEDGHCNCSEHHHAHEHHHEHNHEEPFMSVTYRPKRHYDYDELVTMLNQLDESIIRCKGYVLSNNKTLYFNYVLNEINIFEGKEKTEGLIVAIGTDLNKTSLDRIFKIDD